MYAASYIALLFPDITLKPHCVHPRKNLAQPQRRIRSEVGTSKSSQVFQKIYLINELLIKYLRRSFLIDKKGLF